MPCQINVSNLLIIYVILTGLTVLNAICYNYDVPLGLLKPTHILLLL
jgi:hypothetical protein